MTKDEIIAGLENAIARGESVEKAAQSLINSGYNPKEVKQAVGEVHSSMGVTGHLHQTPQQEQIERQEQQVQPPKAGQAKQEATPVEPQEQTQTPEQPGKPKFPWRIILISIILLLIAGVLAIIFLVP